MNLLASIPYIKSKTSKQVLSPLWSDRDQILNENVNLYCWERTLAPAVHEYVSNILSSDAKPIQLSLSKADMSHQLENVKINWDQHSTSNSQAFWEDITGLVSDFLDFSDTQRGTMHLKIIDNNACAKFHTDGYPLRLLTTYIGQGTEWLPEDSVNRSSLGTSNDQIVKNTTKIQRMKQGDVGILKGELPGNKKKKFRGIVHRSP